MDALTETIKLWTTNCNQNGTSNIVASNLKVIILIHALKYKVLKRVYYEKFL